MILAREFTHMDAGETFLRSSLREIPGQANPLESLGSPTISVPIELAGDQGLTWHFWLCSATHESASDDADAASAVLTNAPFLDEASLRRSAGAVEDAIKRGEGCCAVYSGALNTWVFLDRCKYHKPPTS
jgi:hypothetical protein